MFEDNAMDNGHFDERNKCFCRDGMCTWRLFIYFGVQTMLKSFKIVICCGGCKISGSNYLLKS